MEEHRRGKNGLHDPNRSTQQLTIHQQFALIQNRLAVSVSSPEKEGVGGSIRPWPPRSSIPAPPQFSARSAD